MTIRTERKGTSREVEAEIASTALPPSRGHLPRWTPWAALTGTAVVVGVVLAVTGFSTALFLVATAVVYAVGMYVLSRVVEGRRKATDRLVTIVVTSAFLVALAPLVSVVVTVINNGRRRVPHVLDARDGRRGRRRVPRP
jgi:phosphate transport system permease protein